MKNRSLLVAIVFAAMAGACRDSQEIAAPSAQPSSASQSTLTQSASRDTSRFWLSIGATGDFKPGTPIHINGTVGALARTQRATLRIWLPEVEWTRAHAGRRNVSPVGERFDAAFSVAPTLSAGLSFPVQTTVIAPAAGYYRAVLTAEKESDEPDVADGRVLAPQALAEVWFIIDESGGRVTGVLDYSALPDSVQPVIGPRLLRHRHSQASANATPLASMTTSGGIRTVAYWNPWAAGGAAFVPLSNMAVHGQQFDGYGQPLGTWIAFTWTDSNGQYTAPCPDEQWNYWTGDVDFKDDKIDMTYSRDQWQEDNMSCTEDQTTLSGETNTGFVWSAMHEAVGQSQSLNGVSRSPILVMMRQSGSTGYTTSSYERIDMVIGAATTGTYGYFAQAHEFGHALQSASLGGIDHVSGSCGSVHYLDAADPNEACAWVEGFADYQAVLTDQSKSGTYDTGIKNGTIWPASATNGEVYEAAVARFMWDVQNSSSTTGVSASSLATVVRDCRLSWSGMWLRIASGVDVIWCLNGYDSAIRSTYFPNSRAPYSAISTPVSLTSAQKSAIQTIWLRDLKRQ